MNRGRRLLTVSNRGPLEYRLDEDGDGTLIAVPGSGGLATALRRTATMHPTTWLSNPMTPEDRALASGEMTAEEELPAHFLVTDPDQYALFYGTFANEVLWFLQHGQPWPEELTARETGRAWCDGYQPVNQDFAAAVVNEIDSGSYRAVMFHDYHFYLAPALVKKQRPDAYLQHFVHIPWPALEEWRRLDARLVRQLCSGLLGNDSVVFQTQAGVSNFLACCQQFLPEAEIEASSSLIRLDGRRTRVWANGISVEPAELEEEAGSDEFAEYRYLLKPQVGEKRILSVDRLDPSKNVVGSFRAYERLLETHPELHGKLDYLALLVPSREEIGSYIRYKEETQALIAAINARFGNLHWQPMRVIYENNRTQALAAMSFYDVLVVNSKADGMNLVAKEGPMLNWHNGVLVLSKEAGAYEALREGALGIDPDDVEGTAEALYGALTMPQTERRERAQLLKQAIREHDLAAWFQALLDDIESNAALPAGA